MSSTSERSIDIFRIEADPDFSVSTLNAPDGKGDDKDWFVYNARIPRSWIVALDYRDKANLETGRFGILRSLDFSP